MAVINIFLTVLPWLILIISLYNVFSAVKYNKIYFFGFRYQASREKFRNKTVFQMQQEMGKQHSLGHCIEEGESGFKSGVVVYVIVLFLLIGKYKTLFNLSIIV